MQDKFDIHRAPQTPLRATRPTAGQPDDSGLIREVPATSAGLVRSTLTSGLAAVAVLTIVYLPAEYGIDATGFGSVLGLTEMGQIKQQLYAEAEADDAAAGAPTAAGLDPEATARLERIESQVAAIAAIIGAPVVASPAPPETAAAQPVPEPEVAAAPASVAAEPKAEPEAEVAAEVAAVQAPAASGWRDEVSYTLAPGQGVEVKLAMNEGQTAQFEWSANGSVVNFDTHGDGSGQKVSYEQGRATAEQTGDLTAAFTGNHGWFWRNRTEAPVTITLRTAGDYVELKAP